MACGLLAKFGYSRNLGLDLFKAWRNVVQQTFPSFGWGDASGRSRQKANSQATFELPDGVTERRLRDAQLCRRSCEAAFLAHGDERQQVIQMPALH